MKESLLSILLALITVISFGQIGNYDLYFDDTTELRHLTIDTISNSNNIWQIGKPQKTLFANAYSSPNVIITDTLNSYPINDTSIFIIKNVAWYGFECPHTVILSGKYFVNSDTLSDFGIIEFSPDNDTTWIDLVNDTAYSSFIIWSSKPILTGNSNGWQGFYVNISRLGPVFNIQKDDTVLYRFTFISDSVQTNKDGLMFDDFHFIDYCEGIEEIQNNNLISIAPNPASDQLKIHRENYYEKQFIKIFDYTGRLVYDNSDFKLSAIDTRRFNNGVYILKYSDAKNFAIKKFVINH